MSTATDTDTQAKPCSEQPKPTVGSFLVTVSPTDIYAGMGFNMTVTAMTGKVVGQTAGYGASTLTLDDASQFPSSGSGVILWGVSATHFSWTGKSGNQLTGASGHGTPSNGLAVLNISAVDTGYAGTASIKAIIKGTQFNQLQKTTIDSSDWLNGVASFGNQVLSDPYTTDVPIDFVVREESCPSSGRWGSARATLKNDNQLKFIVFGAGDVARGTNFSITIKAITAGGLADTNYQPASTVNLSSVGDGSDSFTPTSTDNTGWSNGEKTISNCQYNGDTGIHTYKLTATDASDGSITGNKDIVVGATWNSPTIIEVKQYYGEHNSYIDGAPASWNGTLNTAQQLFEADSSLNATGAEGDRYFFYSSNPSSGIIVYEAEIGGGYSAWTVSSALKSAIKAAKVTATFDATYWNTPGPPVWYSESKQFTLAIKLSDSPSTFGSGGAMKAIQADLSINYKTINDIQSHQPYNHSPSTGTATIDLPLFTSDMVSFIKNMSGTSLYIWAYILFPEGTVPSLEGSQENYAWVQANLGGLVLKIGT